MTGLVFVDLSPVYDIELNYTQQFAVKPLLSSVHQKSEQQMASIKQWFAARQHFSSDIVQPIHVGP
jgi:hypothetical protein